METCTKPSSSRHIGTVKIVNYIHEIPRVVLIEAVSQPQDRFLKRKMVWAHARAGFGRPSSTRASSKLFLASFRFRPKQLTHKHKDYTRILRF